VAGFPAAADGRATSVTRLSDAGAGHLAICAVSMMSMKSVVASASMRYLWPAPSFT
jgi:hypothetical protein